MRKLGGLGSMGRVGFSVAAWLAGAILAPSVASAITRSVDNGVACNDVAPCTGTPCCTIQFAIDVSLANDVIEVAAGTYPENLTLAKDLILRGTQVGIPACDRADVETIIAPVAGVGLTLTTGSSSATIDGFTFSGGTRGIASNAGPLNRIKIFNSRFNGFTDSGVFFALGAPTLRFEQNEIDGSSAVGTNGLFHLDGDNDYDGLNFRDTCVRNGANTFGFFADGDHNIGPNVDAGTPLIEDSRFENNQIGVWFGSQTADQMSIARNTFANNALDGLVGGMQNSVIENNSFDSNGRHGLVLTSHGDGGPAAGAQNNSILSNCFSANGHAAAGAGIFYSDTQAVGTIGTNVAHDNNIFGNFGGTTYDGSEAIDAEANWWGCPNGANTVGCDTASANIDTTPFLSSPSENAPCDPFAAPTETPTAVTPTPVETPSMTSTAAATTPTATPTASATPTATPSTTPTGTPSTTSTATASATATLGATPTTSATPSSTSTLTPPDTGTATPTATGTVDPTATESPTPTTSATPTAPITDPATPTATITDDATATPEESATPTPVGPTPTPGPLDHFQCYETHRPPLRLAGISLTDHFGASTVRLLRGKRFCAPADKNDEDPTAPLDPDHLTAFTIKQTTPRFTRIRNFSVTNQFGTMDLDLVRPDALLVPSGKSHVGPLEGYTPLVDHFKCYKARGRLRSDELTIDDQFGTIVGAIKRPVRYCAPVDKNGEGIIEGSVHLVCYQVRSSAGAPTLDTLYSLNQFGPDAFKVYGPRELCVPSTIP